MLSCAIYISQTKFRRTAPLGQAGGECLCLTLLADLTFARHLAGLLSFIHRPGNAD